MSLQLATVADTFSKLSVAGLVIKDTNEIPPAGSDRTPMLIPHWDYLTEVEVIRDSYGAGVAKMTVKYTINYVLLYISAGAGRANVLEYYDDMIALVGAIWDKVLAVSTYDGAVDIQVNSLTGMGVVQDPSGADYIGCNLSFRVTEFVN